MKNLIKLSIVFVVTAAVIFGANSCGDCDLITASYPCNVREATATKFDSRLAATPDPENPGNLIVEPVPTYSNHTFRFPSSSSSSGDLPNDSRFDQNSLLNQKIALAEKEITITGETYYLQAVDYYPNNKNLIGDMLVREVVLNGGVPDSAFLRFYGNVARFPDDFRSEDANRFCSEYIEDYKDIDSNYSQIRSDASRFGRDLPNAFPGVATESENIRILNSAKNEDLTSAILPLVDQNDIDEILEQGFTSAIDLQVAPGEVYYYKARNGKEFAVLIADLNVGNFEPFLRRVTIKFSELVGGGEKTDCPG